MSKKGSKVLEFDPQVYPRKVWIQKGGDVKSLREQFSQVNGDELALDGNFEGLVYRVCRKSDGKLGELIWFPYASVMPISHISHEATHAAIDIFYDCDCRIDSENQEPFAYLVGWIAKCINEVKRGNNGKSKEL